MLQKRKRLFTFAALLLTLSMATLAAILFFRNNDQPPPNVIGSIGSKTSFDVTGQNAPLTETICKDIFRDVADWPESKESEGELAVRPYQVGDFDFYRIGDDNRQPAGYGWFDSGKQFWWAQSNGVIRTATFPELRPLRELSFQGFRIHHLPVRPVMEKREPWRKAARELADLDFRGATCVGNRLFAIFGSEGYSDTNLVEISLPSLDVIGAQRMSKFYYDILELDDEKTIVVKGDRLIGFLDVQTPGNLQVYELGAHRGVRKDAKGLTISIRDQETFTLNKSDSVVSMSHRPDQSTWRVKSGKDSLLDWYTVEIDVNNRIITVRDSDSVIGFADGFSLLGPKFHPDGKLGLAGISGTGTRMPGFGILALATESLPEAVRGSKLDESTTEELPEIRPRLLQSNIPTEDVSEREFSITNLKVEPVAGHVATVKDTVIFDEQFLYYDSSSSSEKRLVTRLNTSDRSVDFVIEDSTLSAVTDGYIIIETQGRFLVLEKDSLEVVRDLGFNSGVRFATGHYGDFFIADRFDQFTSPAAINAATGDRLMYYPRYGGARLSEQQRIREDSRWFDGENDVVQRRFAGLTVVPVSGRKQVELAPSGEWAYSRFGLLQFTWPQVQHTRFGEMPRSRTNPGSEFLPQHFSQDSKFAFFPDNQERAAGEKFVGVVRSLEDIDLPRIELTTDAAQMWIDRNPLTGNFWVRVLDIDDEDFTRSFRMLEFDAAGKLLRAIEDFTDVAQERRFLANGELVCIGEGKIVTVTIK